MGYPSVLDREDVGILRRFVQGQEFKFQRSYGSYVMENVLFKISYPAEFHAQTAVEAAMTLRAQLDASGQIGRRHSQPLRFARMRRACASSTKRDRWRIPRIATIACNT